MSSPRAAPFDTALVPLDEDPQSTPPLQNSNEHGDNRALAPPDTTGPPRWPERPALDKQTPDPHRLAPQIEQLLKGVDTLLRLHEHEAAQRQALQARLECAIEEIALANSPRVAGGLGDEIRKGVSEDLTPYLHAIVDLVELSMRRVQTAPGQVRQDAPSDTGPGQKPCRAAQFGQAPVDDLPCALPDILTKSVEELVRSVRPVKPNGPTRDSSPSQARRPHGQLVPRNFGKGTADGAGAARAGAWIPVTSDTTKP